MIASILKLSGWAGVGFLFGIFAVWWIEPNTSAGTGVIIIICISATMAVGTAISHFFGKSPDDSDGKNA
ncbi:MAG TPA: hypothetical protein VH206_14375 [Xanthobacteraceae bacterium]|jgi:hypothetical protein|nr:hypothetical protein [Xanthobacteraceae bacterium]